MVLKVTDDEIRPIVNKLWDLFIASNYLEFEVFLKEEHNINTTITYVRPPYQQIYFLFESNQEYFAFLLKWS